MTTTRDYYDILGVAKTADEKEIKRAYRKLARKFHPDVNKGDKRSEEKFKEVAEAFAVLSDKDKRARYDRGGHAAFGPGFDPFAGSDFGNFDVGFGDLSSLFEMFGVGAPGGGRRGPTGRRARRGEDLRAELKIPFMTAIRGGQVEISVQRRGTSSGGMKVRIPPGIDDGATLRLSGKGNPGLAGGPAGDAYLTVAVESDPVFRREGRHLYCDVTIGLAQAGLGGTVEIATLDGPATITLPPGTRSGQKLRLKGRGVPTASRRSAGDLFAVIQIEPPAELDPRSRELLEEFGRLNPTP